MKNKIQRWIFRLVLMALIFSCSASLYIGINVELVSNIVLLFGLFLLPVAFGGLTYLLGDAVMTLFKWK